MRGSPSSATRTSTLAASSPQEPCSRLPRPRLKLGRHWPSARRTADASEPAAADARAAQPVSDVRALAGQAPDQLAALVLDHEHDRALVDPEVPGRDPAVLLARTRGEG